MNTQTQVAPAADPLAAFAETPAEPSLGVASTATAIAVAHPQLPVVLLTEITKPGSLIDISMIPQGEMDEIKKLADSIRLGDEESVTMFAYPMQQQYSKGLSELLGVSTLGDASMFELIANDLRLSNEIVAETVQLLKPEEGVGTFRKFVRSIPGIGKSFAKGEVLLKAKERLTDTFEKMEGRIQEKQREVIENQTALNVLARNLPVYLMLLRRHILAGERSVVSMHDAYKAQVSSLPANPDPLTVSDLVNKKNLIVAFETRLIGLKIAYVKSGTLLPQQLSGIKQAGGVVLANLRDTMVLTIPDLKTSALQLVALNNLQEANAHVRGVREQSQVAAEKANELIGKVTLDAMSQQGEVLDEAQRLAKILSSVTALQGKVQEMQQLTASKRAEAEDVLVLTKNAFDEAQKRTAQKFVELTR